jgi:hypothetical protein
MTDAIAPAGRSYTPSSPSSSMSETAISSLSEADLAKRIKENFITIASTFHTNAMRAIEIGELLNEAKRRVKHGAFEEWLDIHCKLSFSTARRYMKFAENRKEIEEQLKTKSVELTDLNFSAARKLIEAGPSTSKGEQEKASKREVSVKKAKQQVETFKKMWNDFADWQQRSFVKLFKARIAELLEEVENEGDALADKTAS